MEMPYRRLGASGLKVSALSFGAWVTFGNQVSTEVARDLLHAAYGAGVNFFDNAETYADGRAETVMGEILKNSGWRRSSYVLSSKVYFGAESEGPNEMGLSRKHVIEGCHGSLRRLQADYLDLFFCHRADPDTPLLETVRAMHDLIIQGKVLYWGTSEWTAAQITEAHELCAKYNFHAPVVEQPQYNLFHRSRFEKELTPVLKERGMGTTIWSPLASGLLTGKYNDGIPEDSRLHMESLEWLKKRLTGFGTEKKLAAIKKFAAVAAGIDTPLPRLAIAWCLKNPQVSTVITGASKVEQLQENLATIGIMERLTPAVMAELDQISRTVAE
ncbi:MAG: aldo/keto reductase [Candidatus Didemnitutus sp.]|nr:aldo/keto reductase [Candidatus Didemnitutus sp.]